MTRHTSPTCGYYLHNYFSGNFWALSRLACGPRVTNETTEKYLHSNYNYNKDSVYVAVIVAQPLWGLPYPVRLMEQFMFGTQRISLYDKSTVVQCFNPFNMDHQKNRARKTIV